jgi:hypothetical protein
LRHLACNCRVLPHMQLFSCDQPLPAGRKAVRVRSEIKSMKHVFLAAAAALIAAGGSAYAQPNPLEPGRPGFSNSASSATQLKALLEDWDRAGFTAPSKPSQYRVYGRAGHVTDGPGYMPWSRLSAPR